MEQPPSFDRVVGNLTEDDKQQVVDFVHKRFDEQKFVDLKEEMEVPKTPEQLEVIDLVNEITSEVIRSYGGTSFDIPVSNVHILKQEEFTKRDKGNEGGSFGLLTQAILMQENPSLVAFAHRLFHEMVHFKSYGAVQVTDSETPRLDNYRTGLNVVSRDGEKEYFENINEAVVEELTRRNLSKVWQHPLFREVMEKSEELKERLDSPEEIVHAEEIQEKTLFGKVSSFLVSKGATVRPFSYPQQRKIMNELIDKLYDRNEDKFKDREEVFELFAKGEVTGKLLELGRLIENTFGKGTFRSLGEFEAGDIGDMEEFVREL